MTLKINTEEKKYVFAFCKHYELPLPDEKTMSFMFNWLSGNFFYSNGIRDSKGRFYHNNSSDFIERKLDAETLLDKKITLPNNHSFALCLTHDVDIIRRYIGLPEYINFSKKILNRSVIKEFGIQTFINQAVRKTVKHGYSYFKNDPLGCYEKWLKVEDIHGFKSSFLFFANPIKKSHLIDCDYSFKDKIKFDCITGKGERSKQEDTSFMYNIELYVNNKTYNI